jgi:hypothetical protein
MTTTTHDIDIDWKAATQIADALGRRTLVLVSERDPEAVLDWALTMAQASSVSSYMATRALSYLELAVLVGHAVPEPERTPGDDERLGWLVSKVADIEQLKSTIADIKGSLTGTQEKVETVGAALARLVAEQDPSGWDAAREEQGDE